MKKTLTISKILLGCLTLSLLAGCERIDYTTWSCQKNSVSKAQSMKLDGSTMEFLNEKYRFCGSLGLLSYFDQTCPPQVSDSKLMFYPKTGELKVNEQTFQCQVL